MGIIQQTIANSLISGSLYALLALGITLIYGAMPYFDFSTGVFALIGAYGVFFLSKEIGMDPVLAGIIAVLVSGGVAMLVDRFVMRRLRAKKSNALVMLIAALGVLTALQALIAIIFSNEFHTLANAKDPVRIFEIGSAFVTQYQLIGMVASVMVTALLTLFIKKTRVGKAIRALSDDEEVARIVGINTNNIILVIFFIAGVTSAMAGIFVGYDTGFDPSLGLHLFFKGVVAAIIGGLGSVPGAFLAAYILGFAENFGVLGIAAEWKDAIAFVLLLIFLTLRPQGILKK